MTLVQAYKKRRLAYGGDLYGETYLQDIPGTLQESQAKHVVTPPSAIQARNSVTTDFDPNGPVQRLTSDKKGLRGDGALKNGITGVVAGGAGLVNMVTDTVSNPDPLTGRVKVGSYIAKGAAQGATLGSSLGWIGAAAGAVIGGGLGWAKGAKVRKQARTELAQSTMADKMKAQNYSMNAVAADPTLVSGYKNSSYFANGGAMTKIAESTSITAPLASAYMSGGRAKALSSNSTELIGRPHSAGGIDIEGMGEVEDGETTMDNFVFSKKLGFANLHKPIAVAKGKIEKKPLTFERGNSLKRLREREEGLANLQEKFKKAHNLN